MDLFAEVESENIQRHQPLAPRLRPRSLQEFVVPRHFLGEGKLLAPLDRAAKRLGRCCCMARPGTGKTRLHIC